MEYLLLSLLPISVIFLILLIIKYEAIKKNQAIEKNKKPETFLVNDDGRIYEVTRIEK